MTHDPEVTKYIESFEGVTGRRLEQLRDMVAALAPDATENFGYGLAAYKRNGKPLVYFGGFARHIGFYATPNGHNAFADDFANYKQGKGSVQFPHSQPLPDELIKRVLLYRIEQTK